MEANRSSTRAAAPGACWCGATGLEAFRSDYGRCCRCGTVVYTEPSETRDPNATGDAGFYGSHYWQYHVPRVLGLPGLDARARSYLADRAIYYLKRTLERVAPGAAVLDLGCAPGSFAYLMAQAGMTVEGLEVGSGTVQFVERTFELKLHRGPLEHLRLRRTFDAITAIDLLEHLPDPVATLRACARRLRPNGVLLLQTPCYRDDGPAWPMLVPAEHLYLYTADSIRALLGEAGFAVVEVTPSLFPYDMWVVASRHRLPLTRHPPSAGVKPAARALIDLYDVLTATRAQLGAVADDRGAKDALILHLADELEIVRADQHAKEALIARLNLDLEAVRGDQHSKEILIARIDAELETVRADQRAKEELIVDLGSELHEVQADRQAKEATVGRLSRELEDVRADQRLKEALIVRVSEELALVRADQQAKAALIAQLAVPHHEGRTAPEPR